METRSLSAEYDTTAKYSVIPAGASTVPAPYVLSDAEVAEVAGGNPVVVGAVIGGLAGAVVGLVVGILIGVWASHK
jgi:hypothetical protein